MNVSLFGWTGPLPLLPIDSSQKRTRSGDMVTWVNIWYTRVLPCSPANVGWVESGQRPDGGESLANVQEEVNENEQTNIKNEGFYLQRCIFFYNWRNKAMNGKRTTNCSLWACILLMNVLSLLYIGHVFWIICYYMINVLVQLLVFVYRISLSF